MKENSDESYLSMSGNKRANAGIDNNCKEYEDVHEFLGTTTDSKLTI